MNTILYNWNLFRVLRLILGIAIMIKGIVDGDYVFTLAGTFLAVMAVANLGCCSSTSCSVSPTSRKISKQSSYEEPDTSK